MKRIVFAAVAGFSVFACTKSTEEMIAPVNSGRVAFIASFENDPTKVITESGVSQWDSGDEISVFSVSSEGTMIGNNVSYKTKAAGDVGEFIAVDNEIEASDTYLAFYPYEGVYPSALNAASTVGFTAVAKGDPVVDYRFMPIAINSGYNFKVDSQNGSVTSDSKQFFWASAESSGDGSPVSLIFKPAMPVLELGIRGIGTVASVAIAYTDKASDKLSGNTWLSGKGIFDIATGTLTTTNTSSSAYCTIKANFTDVNGNSYAELDPGEPLRFQLTTGRFTVTKGLTLTITDKDGKTIKKTIWADKTVSSIDASGNCKHIYQPIVLPSIVATAIEETFPTSGGSASVTVSSTSDWTLDSKPEWISLSSESGSNGSSVTVTAEANDSAPRQGNVVLKLSDGTSCSIAVAQEGLASVEADYYSVALNGVNWSASNVYHIKNASGGIIAMLTNEYLGKILKISGIIAYPAPAGTPDYSNGLMVELTNNAGASIPQDGHCGTVNANTKNPEDVVYTAGTNSAPALIYIKADGSEILTSEPVGVEISVGILSPFTLVSDVKSHPTVKLGSMIWLAENYKTRSLCDGTEIPQNTSQKADWTTGSLGVVITDAGEYCYSGWTLGFNTSTPAVFTPGIFAPQGWELASKDDVLTDLLGYVGAYLNLTTRSNFNPTVSTPIVKATGIDLKSNYFAVRTSTPGTGANSQMVLFQSTGDPKTSAQGLAIGLPVRLIMKASE